ncbi:hypothetical protein K474DRAFT_1683610 [Panus rudis PR-1116 ss-1]|nr:hypothetical protein K474DRAFT_1683610 [Panus rudis PR-1116 ss-1]
MSFSSPQPLKSARTLRRTGSYISLTDMQAADNAHHLPRVGTCASQVASEYSAVPYTRSMRHYKEQRDRRKALARTTNEPQPVFTITPVSIPAPTPKPAKVAVATTPFSRPRSNSPLSPVQQSLPPRTHYPRSKPEPDLYRVAITTRMRMSPTGQKILHMGPRLALSIHAATQELERIVAAHQLDLDGDVNMSGGNGVPSMSTSWIVVPPEDWEMITTKFFPRPSR